MDELEAQIASALRKLRETPPERKGSALRIAVAKHATSIASARGQGYSLSRIAQVLREAGVPGSVETIRYHLSGVLAGAAAKKKANARKKPAAAKPTAAVEQPQSSQAATNRNAAFDEDATQ